MGNRASWLQTLSALWKHEEKKVKGDFKEAADDWDDED